jgi:hypothetical protein
MTGGIRPVVRWTALLGAAAVFAVGVGVSYEHAREERERNDFAAEARNVETSAALTAEMVRWAHRQCSAIGMPTLSACRIQGGTLVEGHLAAPLARNAIDQYDHWTASCNRHYPPDFCHDLIDRELKSRGVSR